MHFILYGPEGSGKGTQAKLLAQKYGLPVYTSGDLVREAAQSDKGIIGDACRKALSEGLYVPDSEMFVLWKNKLKTPEAKKGFVLDGFPRNIHQAMFLMKKLDKYGYDIDKFIYLELSDEEAIRRLSKRKRSLFPGSKINHDDPKRVASRLKVYREQEKDVLAFFNSRGNILLVDAKGSVDKVFERVVKSLNNK